MLYPESGGLFILARDYSKTVLLKLLVSILVLNVLNSLSTQVFRKNMPMKALYIYTDITLGGTALHPEKELN